MSEFSIEPNGNLPPPDEDRPDFEPSRFANLKRVGKTALAVAGAAWTLMVAGAIESPASAAPETPLSSPLSVDAKPFEVGVATYSWWSENGHQMFNDMGSIGMNVVRLNLSRETWQRDVSVIEHEVVSAEANGIEPVVILQQNSGRPEPDWANWAAHMGVLLPQVHRFIDQNEPNSKQFWTGTLQQYADQLHQTYLAMHAARPDVVVSGVGLDSIEKNDPEDWLKRFMNYVTEKYGSPHAVMDTLSVHLYRSTAKDEQMINEDEGEWDGPINIDEFGRPVKNVPKGYNPPSAVTKEQQAKDYSAFMSWAFENVQVRSIVIYHWDNPRDPNDLHTGLNTPANVPLPSFHAVASTIKGVTVPYVSP